MRRIASLCGLTLLVVTLLGTQACGRTSLHKSFGQRYRDINVAQYGAHPAHDVTVRGAETDVIIQTYTTNLSQSSSGGAATPTVGPSLKTAGIPPLH
jgi:hypothetical protein